MNTDKKRISVFLTSLLLTLSLISPVYADNLNLVTSTQLNNMEISSVSDDTISSNDSYDRFSFSGIQSSIFESNDGKYVAIQGTKIFVGIGATSLDKKVLNINN